jgi:hypothetical protein
MIEAAGTAGGSAGHELLKPTSSGTGTHPLVAKLGAAR